MMVAAISSSLSLLLSPSICSSQSLLMSLLSCISRYHNAVVWPKFSCTSSTTWSPPGGLYCIRSRRFGLSNPVPFMNKDLHSDSQAINRMDFPFMKSPSSIGVKNFHFLPSPIPRPRPPLTPTWSVKFYFKYLKLPGI